MKKVVVSGSGLYVPPNVVYNEELADVFNQYVRDYNQIHQADIAAGLIEPLKESSSEFFVKAAGIKQRFMVEKAGVLDPKLMRPIIPERPHFEISIQAEMGLAAAKQALANANKKPEDIEFILVGSSSTQRPYPAIAIEIQSALGAKGYGYDISVACSSATFGLQSMHDAIRNNHAKCGLVIDVELGSCMVDFCDRDSHFIFGDAAVALVVETTDTCTSPYPFEYISSKLMTQFSNNIRSDFGFLNRLDPNPEDVRKKLFRQKGRQVFKEVINMASEFITEHLHANGFNAEQLVRLWLHQANINMNNLIAGKVLGRPATQEESPIVLDKYANTASAGSVIAFHEYHKDLKPGDLGLMCSFGAGYSVGSVILRRL